MESVERKDDGGYASPTSVLYHPRIGRQTICKLHSRDFSDCLRYHTAQHPFWDDIKSVYRRSSAHSMAIAGPSSSSKFQLPELPPRIIFQARSTRSATVEDPFKLLGPDILHLVMVRLDALSLARCGVTSKDWKTLAHSDALWVSKIASPYSTRDRREICASLWQGKRHIPAAALLPGLSKVAAYGISMKDSKRCSITLEDLCQHGWEYRFKDTVPQYWLELDPSRRGEAPMQRFFHSDGSQTAGPGDAVWGGHESTFSIIQDEGQDHDSIARSNFVRINHWPRMVVSRTADWGWELHNEICVYTSLADSSQGGTGPEYIRL
ncbi:uncharacterized protein LOC9643613 isoform X1 [Selaginella moellendorffii]|uniref:uncharacterized protein LOC9643613 isoform X1 n=1 Tax=Selaginella moellendorffii TaxID=88036 RepID=UPI000D1C7B02|nr:uncharacterized protein LOC9643613 isoform X1 [Selaginella moellendorffii]|eukprot:XP_024522344.1 uncharacterized protein LOC9643613 isoform X1 [Selaginella moellendorffii]